MGGGGSDSQSKSKSQSASYSQPQYSLLKQAISAYSPQIGQGANVYQGNRVAGFSPGMEESMAQYGGYLDAFNPNRAMPTQFGETGTALSGILSGQTGAQYITPEQTSSYYKSNIEDPARYEFQKNTAPAIAEQYAGPGYWSSARAKAGATANQELGNWLGEQKGQLDWQTQEANRAVDEAKANRSLAAVPLGMNYSQLPTMEAMNRLQGTQGVFGLLQPQQELAQQQIGADMQKFFEENQITNPEDMAIIMQLLGLNYSRSSSASSSLAHSGQGGVGQG